MARKHLLASHGFPRRRNSVDSTLKEQALFPTSTGRHAIEDRVTSPTLEDELGTLTKERAEKAVDGGIHCTGIVVSLYHRSRSGIVVSL
jgi:hypothetical protein